MSVETTRESQKMTVQEFLDEKDADLKAKGMDQKAQAKAGHEARSKLGDVVDAVGLTNSCGLVVLGPSRSKAGSESWIQESFVRLAEAVLVAKLDLEQVLE